MQGRGRFGILLCMQKGRLIGAVIGALIGLRGGSLWNVFFYAWFGAWLGGIIAARYLPRRAAKAASPQVPRRTLSAREKALRTLGLPSNATPAQARAAYRKLAWKYHPDALRARGADSATIESATETMARLNEAWHTLTSAS